MICVRLRHLALLLAIAASGGVASAKTVSIDKCGVLKNGRSTYVLQKDIVAEGTCFSVQDDEITLDLNGHTLTYAATDMSGRRHAVIGTACYGPHLDKNPCGGSFSNLTVQNGKIVQGAIAAPYSDAIRIGQGGARNLTVHDVEFVLSGDSAKAISTAYAKGGHKIFRNTIRSSVKKIGSRHQLDGVTIKLDNEGKPATTPNEIYNNTIIGSVQGGIHVTAPGSKVYSNNISLNANYTNDFCIYAWASGAQVYGNTCDNTEGTNMGRGIHVAASDVAVFKNVIKVRELPRNEEYSGCQVGGAYGIQLESYATNARIYDNDVTALADSCDAIALRVTSTPETASNVVYHNRLTAQRLGASTRIAAAFSPNNVSGGVTLRENVLTSDSTAVLVPWDGGKGIRLESNTYQIGTNPPRDGWAMFVFKNSKASQDFLVIDPKFVNGASANAKMRQVGFGNWAGEAGFRVGWTTRIVVSSPEKSRVAGASVTARDSAGNTVFEGKTDGSGVVVLPLVERRYFNTKTEAFSKESLSPYSVAVEATGFIPASQYVKATQTQEVDITLKSR